MRASCKDLGVVDYAACWQMQQRLFDALLAEKALRNPQEVRAETDLVGTILLVEHPPVYTLGKSGHTENLLIDRAALERLGAQFFHIDRGGDVTFHGPGQVVCYPILDLEKLGIGLREYIAALEEAVICTVGAFGITAGRIAGASGVWIHVAGGMPRKICALGVRSSRFVTMHGFALNVNTDLHWFSHINPCGFTDKGVTSMAQECGAEISMEQVKVLIVKFLSEKLNVKIYNN
ncbi:MAG: lipoyl(octanoyl) transferase LipB [Alistipes sp.]